MSGFRFFLFVFNNNMCVFGFFDSWFVRIYLVDLVFMMMKLYCVILFFFVDYMCCLFGWNVFV